MMGVFLLAGVSFAAELRHFRLDLAQPGTVQVDVPVVNRALVRLNGEIALDLRDRTNPGYRPTATILSVLPQGSHILSVEGGALNPNRRTAIRVRLPGQTEQLSLSELPALSAEEVALLMSARAPVLAPGATPSSGASGSDPTPSLVRKPFTLGVSRSQ
ncbi:MAG: hypothetical protein AAFR93_11485 [Pseudomonadota bacterium]